MLARAAAKASAWRLRSPQLVTWPWWSMTAGVVGRASAFSTSRSQKVSCGHAPDRRYRSTWSRVRTVSSRRMSSSARAHTRAVRSGVVAMLHLLGRAGGLALPWGGPGTPSSASRGVLLVLDDRDPGTEGGPPPRGRADVHGPAEELGALPDSDEAKVTAGREVAVRGDREAPSVVGDVEPDLIPCEGQPHHDPGGLGVPLDVPDRLLGDAEEPELDGGREPPGDPDDVDPPAESRAAARLLHQLAEGRHEPQVVQDGGAEGVGELPQGPDEALGRGAGLPKGRGGLPGEGPADALHRVELAAQEDEFLDRVVVQLVGEPPSLLLVGPQDAGGEDPEVLLAAALFGHVAQQERVEVLSDPDDARVHPDHRPPARPHLEGPPTRSSRRAASSGPGPPNHARAAGFMARTDPAGPRIRMGRGLASNRPRYFAWASSACWRAAASRWTRLPTKRAMPPTATSWTSSARRSRPRWCRRITGASTATHQRTVAADPGNPKVSAAKVAGTKKNVTRRKDRRGPWGT